MEDAQVKKLFGVLARISPDSAYMARSKQLIAMTRQEAATMHAPLPWQRRFFESLTVIGAIALTSFLVIIALGSLSYAGLKENGSLASSLNATSLISEAKSADFELQIQAVTYFNESSKQVASALDKISHDNAPRLSP